VRDCRSSYRAKLTDKTDKQTGGGRNRTPARHQWPS